MLADITIPQLKYLLKLLKFPPQFAYQIAHGTSMLENKLYGIQSDGATTLKILNIPKKITHMYKAIYVEIPFLKI